MAKAKGQTDVLGDIVKSLQVAITIAFTDLIPLEVRRINKDVVSKLALSMATEGFRKDKMPFVNPQIGKDGKATGKYYVVCGNHRTEAWKSIPGKTAIDCVVSDKVLSDVEMIALAVRDNADTRPLTTAEIAHQVWSMQQRKLTLTQIAQYFTIPAAMSAASKETGSGVAYTESYLSQLRNCWVMLEEDNRKYALNPVDPKTNMSADNAAWGVMGAWKVWQRIRKEKGDEYCGPNPTASDPSKFPNKKALEEWNLLLRKWVSDGERPKFGPSAAKTGDGDASEAEAKAEAKAEAEAWKKLSETLREFVDGLPNDTIFSKAQVNRLASAIFAGNEERVNKWIASIKKEEK